MSAEPAEVTAARRVIAEWEVRQSGQLEAMRKELTALVGQGEGFWESARVVLDRVGKVTPLGWDRVEWVDEVNDAYNDLEDAIGGVAELLEATRYWTATAQTATPTAERD